MDMVYRRSRQMPVTPPRRAPSHVVRLRAFIQKAVAATACFGHTVFA
jgi:hypothetical protein